MPTESPRSTLMFSAQTRSYGLKVSENTELSAATSENAKNASSSSQQHRTPKKGQSQRIYYLLPKHNTPVRKPVKNPFNERLIEVFNRPTCSPDFCSSFASPAPENVNKNDFFWTAEDLWRLDPVHIESPQTDIEDNLDEETESLAQEAIERYFQESHNILSPIGSPKSRIGPDRGETPDLPTPICLAERAMSTPCARYDSRRTMKMTVATQTLLSFSSDIPDSILDLLKPFTNILDESKIDLSNTSSSNLCRKLFFNKHWDSSSSESEDESNGSKKITTRFLPLDWTPDRVQSTVDLFSKSPDISPIADGILSKQTDCFDYQESDLIISSHNGEKLSVDHLHMSVDFGAESIIDSSNFQQGASQCSADTGYQTNISDKSHPSSADALHTEYTFDKKLMRSNTGVCDTSDSGITLTPTHK